MRIVFSGAGRCASSLKCPFLAKKQVSTTHFYEYRDRIYTFINTPRLNATQGSELTRRVDSR